MKIINLLLFSLLTVSVQVLAERPAMDARPAASEPQPVMATTLPEDDAGRPAANEAPLAMEQTLPEGDIDRPAASEQAMDQEPAEEPRAITGHTSPPAPVTTTVTTTTGTALEIQPGETLPVRAPDFPRRGMSMDKVQNELGRPIEISPTVGEPPITSWVYDDRVVYFEHSKVIHAVSLR